MIAVATSVIKSNPALVQDYVCAELQGSRDMTGPQAAKYLAASRPWTLACAGCSCWPTRAGGGERYWSPARTDVMRWVLKPSQCIRPT